MECRNCLQADDFQALGITDGFYSKGEKIGGLEELKHKTAIYNKSVIAAGGD